MSDQRPHGERRRRVIRPPFKVRFWFLVVLMIFRTEGEARGAQELAFSKSQGPAGETTGPRRAGSIITGRDTSFRPGWSFALWKEAGPRDGGHEAGRV